MKIKCSIFYFLSFAILISGVFGDCVHINTSGCKCNTTDTIGGLKCGYELDNHCPSDPGSIFQCTPDGTSTCRYDGGCKYGCCATGDGNSYCCKDNSCSGCPPDDWHKNVSPTTTFQTPDVITISYIKKNPGFFEYCMKDLSFIQPIKNAACFALNSSANDDLPDSFLENDINGNFDKWARKKEYRGYIHIPSFNVSCDAGGHLLTFNPHDPDYSDQNNSTQHPEKVVDTERNPYGYTKIRKGCLRIPPICPDYSSADIYTKNPFNGILWSTNSDNTCLNIHDARSSRLPNPERRIQYQLLLRDAPFIYTQVDMTVCCSRQVSVNVSRTIFPQTRLYINGKTISEQAQTELGKFIASGGKKFERNPDGEGNLAPPGQGLTWNGKV